MTAQQHRDAENQPIQQKETGSGIQITMSVAPPFFRTGTRSHTFGSPVRCRAS
jgi:hypothetical protein